MAWAKDDGVDIDDDMKVAQWAQQYGQESHKVSSRLDRSCNKSRKLENGFQVAAFSHRFAVVRRTHIQSRVLELASNSSTARSTVAALAALQSSCGVPRRLSVAVQGNTTKRKCASIYGLHLLVAFSPLCVG